MTAKAVFAAPELVRALTNVNGFVPAASKFPVVRYELVPGLTVTAADLYTVGSEDVEPIEFSGAPESIIVSSEHSKALEKFVREAKRGEVTLELNENGLRAIDVDRDRGEFPPAYVEGDPEKWDRFFELVEEVMVALERRTEEELRLPDAIAFQPQRLAAFAKVRVPGDGVVMDLSITTADDAVLVKIGPTFRGAIQPVTRAKANPEMLWPE